ncbi:MAG: hypothetical protein WDM91_23420 [Rhizomicrobium sp.]
MADASVPAKLAVALAKKGTKMPHHHPKPCTGTRPRLMGVETVDHPAKGEIPDFARKFFMAKGRTAPQYNRSA